MPEDNDNWVENLIALGVGALAAYFLYKIVTSSKEDSDFNTCPYCGAPIKKWAIECPRCRKRLPGRTPL